MSWACTCSRPSMLWSWRWTRSRRIPDLDRTALCLPIVPATPDRQTCDYVRHRTTSLFAAYDLASGSVIAQHYRRYRHQEFLRFLKLIDGAVPKGMHLNRPRRLSPIWGHPASALGPTATMRYSSGSAAERR